MPRSRFLAALLRAVALTTLVLGVIIVIRVAMGWAILWNWVAIVGLAGVAVLTLVEYAFHEEPGLLRSLKNAPIDEEPETETEREAKESLQRGEAVPHEEVVREFLE